MAIPGYTPVLATETAKNYLGEVVNKDKDTVISSLAEYFSMPRASVAEVWNELERRCNEAKMPNLLFSDGTLDWGLIYPIPGEKPALLNDIAMVGHPGMAGVPPVFTTGFLHGQLTIFFGEYAELYIQQATQVIPAALTAPSLVIVDSSGLVLAANDSVGGVAEVVETPTFLATFMTRYGETEASNIVSLPRVYSWNTVTLAIDENKIPTYAGTVRYYRLFGDTYRLVSEVKIT